MKKNLKIPKIQSQITSKRNVSFIEITLSKKELDKANIGYQEPLDPSLVVEVDPEDVLYFLNFL